MAKQIKSVGGVRVVFRVFNLNVGVFRRMGSSVKIKGGRSRRGDISIVNTYSANLDGAEFDVTSRSKRCDDTKRCTQAEFWIGMSATMDGGGNVRPGGAPESAVTGVRADATVTVRGETESFSGSS